MLLRKQTITKQGTIWFQTQFYQLRMDKKFQRVVLLQDYHKKQQKQKILLEDYPGLLNYLKLEKPRIVLSLLKMMEKFYLEKR